MRKYLVLPFVLIATPVVAQQVSDQAFLQQAIAAVQSQRNQALDAMAACQAQSSIAAAEVDRLKQRIAELEKAAK
jgi:hypothetical protein